MTRAAIYCRVSTPGQEAEGTSLETQETRCRAFLAERGYDLDAAHVYRDVHSGAELKQRPALSRVREAMARRAFDVVITYAVDRLSREQNQLGAIVYEADDIGVRLEFVTEDFDNSAVGKFIRSAKAFVGEVEREKITERTMRGKRARFTAGKLLPGCRPLYGYQFTEDRTAYLVDPVTGPIVQRIFTEANLVGTLRAIAAGLTADRIASPSGRAAMWWPASVRWILTNPTYTGEAIGWRYTTINSEQIQLPEGTVPALVDPTTFADLQTMLKGNKARSVRNNHEPERWLLRGGYVRCARCGYAMHAGRARAGGKTYYRCSRNSAAPSQCSTPLIPAETLDVATWERVEAILIHPDLIATKLAELQANDPTAHDAAAVERQIAEVQKRHQTLRQNLAQTAMTPKTAQRTAVDLADLEADEDRLQAQLAAIQEQRQTWEAAQANLTDLQAWCRQVADRLGTLTYQQRRLALDYLAVEARVFDATHYEITAALPLDAASIVKRSS